jgi:hypothetical protein
MGDAWRIIEGIPWAEVQDLADELIEGGLSEDEALDAIAEFLDKLVDFSDFVPAPIGGVVEIVDRPVIRAALGLVLAFAKDPERRARRQARREERRAEREKRRAERRAKREARRE